MNEQSLQSEKREVNFDDVASRLQEIAADFTSPSPEGEEPSSDEDFATRGVHFIEEVNKAYKGTVARCGENALRSFPRFSSGILSLDLGLCGGWPIGKMGLIIGPESSGKTTLSMKAAGQIKHHDAFTGLHYSQFEDPKDFTPCRTAFVDLEFTFDAKWAAQHGWNPDYDILIQPDYAEQAIDIVQQLIEQKVAQLIIVDSIAAMIPSAEYTDSAEDHQVGLQARLCNKACRKWTSALAKAGQGDTIPPTIIMLNQFREKIGILFGDNRTFPGGKGQRYTSSIRLELNPAKVDNSEKKEFGIGEFGGIVKKNKTGVPRITFGYRMALKNTKEMPIGSVDNLKQLVDKAKALGVLRKSESKNTKVNWESCGKEFRTQKEFNALLCSDPSFGREVWNHVLQAHLDEVTK